MNITETNEEYYYTHIVTTCGFCERRSVWYVYIQNGQGNYQKEFWGLAVYPCLFPTPISANVQLY